MNIVFLLLGANLDQPLAQINKAQLLLSNQLGLLSSASTMYETQAWGVEDQPPFLNQVITILTEKTPQETLLICQKIENELGRIRQHKWGSRVIDIDILYYNDLIIHEPTLIIPHPYLHLRKFTLVPLVEIAENFMHPSLHQTNKELLDRCIDPLTVKPVYNV